MSSKDEFDKLNKELDHLIETYEKSSDPEIKRKVQQLKKLKEKTSLLRKVGKRALWIWVADRIRDIIEGIEDGLGDLWPPW